MALDNRFRYCYRYTPSRHGFAEHVYEVIGRDGAVHFHVTVSGRASDHGLPRYSGGLEEHRKQCPPYRDCAPDHMDCRLTGGPCWHDGTSLYAMEVLIPQWERDFPDHDAVFAWLTHEYINRFRIVEGESE